MTKKLLIIGSVWPEPKSSAAGSRMLQLIQNFQSQKFDITFASPSIRSERAFDLNRLGIDQITIEINASSFDDFVKSLNPNIVLFDRFMTEEQFGWRVTEHCPNALRILDTEDLHGLRKGREQALKEDSFFDKSYLFNDTFKREIASIYRCDLSLIISEEEMELLMRQFKVDEHIIYYLPFLVDAISAETQQSLPKFKERQDFITIGNFLHAPNVDSLNYLKKEIWPIIHKALPKSKMNIYGAYISQKVKQLHDDKSNFLIHGFTDDVNKVMKQAKVCVAPLRFGAGLKGKLIDAMINGTPSVTTSIGAEGMYGNVTPNAFIEDNPKAFAEKCIELYTNKIYWNGLQKNGFVLVNTRFDKQVFVSDFMYRIEAILQNINTHRLQNFTGQMLQYHTLQSTKYMSKWIEVKNKN